jgi:hypothetical protein
LVFLLVSLALLLSTLEKPVQLRDHSAWHLDLRMPLLALAKLNSDCNMINGFVETHTKLHSVHPCQKLGDETPCLIKAWSFISNKKMFSWRKLPCD